MTSKQAAATKSADEHSKYETREERSIADYARSLSVAELEREIAVARRERAGDDYVSDLERILEDKRAAATRDTDPAPPEAA